MSLLDLVNDIDRLHSVVKLDIRHRELFLTRVVRDWPRLSEQIKALAHRQVPLLAVLAGMA